MSIFESLKRKIDVTDARVCRIVANVDDVFRLLNLTVVCVQCGETPKMGNALVDYQWKMDCQCTERRLVNPDRRREKILS